MGRSCTLPPTAPLIFTPVTAEQYQSLIQKANNAGLALQGNAGTASKLGVEVAWDYAPESLQCLSAPFFMNSDTVNAKIRSLVQETVSARA
jgi:hypothetical protein